MDGRVRMPPDARREHRAMVKAHLRKGTRRTQVERVMLLLVESGALYCGLWVSLGNVYADSPPGV